MPDPRPAPRVTRDPLATALIELARAVLATDPARRRAKMTVVDGGKRGGETPR